MRWRFVDSGKVPEGIFIFRELTEFTFSCKFLNHLFSTLAVRGWRDFACSDEFCIICLPGFCGVTAHFHLAYLSGDIGELFGHYSNGLVTAFLQYLDGS